MSQDLCATDAMEDMTFTIYASRIDRVRMVTLLRRHTTISVIVLLTARCVISPSPLHISSSHHLHIRVPFPLNRRMSAKYHKRRCSQDLLPGRPLSSARHSFRARRVIFGVPVADLRSTVVFHVTGCHSQTHWPSPVSHFRHRRFERLTLCTCASLK